MIIGLFHSCAILTSDLTTGPVWPLGMSTFMYPGTAHNRNLCALTSYYNHCLSSTLVHLDTWTHGHMPTWTPGHLDTCTPGHMDTWTHGHMPTCTPGHLYTWTPVHLDTCTPGHLYTCTPVHLDTWTPGHLDIWVERRSNSNSCLAQRCVQFWNYKVHSITA